MSDPNDHKNATMALLIGATGSFLGNVNGSIINVLLPTISQSFQRGIGDVAILSLAFYLILLCQLALTAYRLKSYDSKISDYSNFR